MQIPNVWHEDLNTQITDILHLEAERRLRLFTIGKNPADWLARRQELKQKLWSLLGCRYDATLPLDCQITRTIRQNGYRIDCLHYQSRPGLRVTANLYVPDGPGPFPGVINMHGHWSQGHLAARVQMRGHLLAQEGYVVLIVDAFGSGERCPEHGTYEYHGQVIGGALLQAGETLMGAQVVDNMRGIDLLQSLPCVDPGRIGATGASGGGNQTMWVTAMDDRIKASVPVVSVGSFASYVGNTNCICELLPYGLTETEESGVLALTAPRPLKICNCLHDSNPTFFVTEMLRSFKDARAVYQLLNADQNFTYQAFNLPHGYWPEVAETMLGFFDFHLRGIGHGAPRTPAKPFQTLPENELMVFAPGTRPDDFKTIPAWCQHQGRELAASRPAATTASLQQLFHVLKPRQLAESRAQSLNDGWQPWTLLTSDGHALPLLYRPRQNGSRLHLLSAPEGKASMADSPLLQNALAAGDGVLLFDLYGCGETMKPETQTRWPWHLLSRSLLWLGRTLLGEWAMDYALVADFARTLDPQAALTAAGTGEAAIAAQLAVLLKPDSPITAVVSSKQPDTLAWTTGQSVADYTASHTMAGLVPGFLAWGDVSDLERLLQEQGVSLTRA